MSKYYVVSVSEDGDCSIDEYSHDKLQKLLNDEDYWLNEKFHTHMPSNTDLQEGTWSGKLMIIKGEIIVPRTKEVIKELELE